MEIKILAAVCWSWVAVYASPTNERNRVKNNFWIWEKGDENGTE